MWPRHLYQDQDIRPRDQDQDTNWKSHYLHDRQTGNRYRKVVWYFGRPISPKLKTWKKSKTVRLSIFYKLHRAVTEYVTGNWLNWSTELYCTWRLWALKLHTARGLSSFLGSKFRVYYNSLVNIKHYTATGLVTSAPPISAKLGSNTWIGVRMNHFVANFWSYSFKGSLFF